MACFWKLKMPNVQTYNINETDIWKRVDNIGSTTYINVTDGTQQTVPWGSMDYWNIITGNLLGLGLLGAIIYVIAKFTFKF